MKLICMSEQNLGEMIRQARLRKGWTQEELARRVGVKTSYVSQWETGARKWPQEYVRSIASLLGLSQLEMAVAAGIIDDPEIVTTPEPVQFAEDDPRADIMRLLADINDENATNVLALVRAMWNSRRQLLTSPEAPVKPRRVS